MLDRAGRSNDLFRFSTTVLQWELDADLVSGSPPSARSGHAMAAVGSDIVVFGGDTDQGEEARQISRRRLLRALLLCARGRMVSSGGAVPGLDGAIEHVVYFSQVILRICWCTLRHE